MGALVSESEFSPRMRIVPAVPVIVPGSTITPGALATSRSPMFVVAVSSTRLPTLPSVEMALPNSTFRCSPVAVVTTSWSWTMIGFIVKSSVAEPPAAIVTDFFCSAKPTCRTRISAAPDWAARMV